MADTVSTTVIFQSKRLYVVKLLNLSDATGESAVLKVDVSTLTGPTAAATARVTLLKANWSVNSKMDAVSLLWDADTDVPFARFSGQGEMCWEEYGGIVNPKTTGWTGDVLLTTTGAVASGVYDLTLVFRKEAT